MLRSALAKCAPNSGFSQQFPPDSLYDPERDVPDLTSKIVIVTGGNSGIGYHTVKQLLLKNAKVYLAARSLDKCTEAVKRLKEETNGKEPILLRLDLGDLTSVREAAEEFLSKEERLDILFNSAGVMVPPLDQLTKQGYDLQFGTNVVGHYLFTILLMPALRRSTAHHKTRARVINTSSSGHKYAPGKTGVVWETLKGGEERDKALKKLGSGAEWKMYGISKLGNIFVSNILVEYYGDVVMSCSLHPGGIKTGLTQHIPSWQQRLSTMILHPAPLGAYNQLWAGTSPDGDGLNGKYVIPWARIGDASPRAANAETRDKLKAYLANRSKALLRPQALTYGLDSRSRVSMT